MKQFGRKSKIPSQNYTESCISDKMMMKASVSRQIQAQQNRALLNEKTIESLTEKIQYYTNITKQKRQKLQFIEKEIKLIEEKKSKLPLMKQLRDHFKKLKQELGSAFSFQVQQDDIDVDTMTYEQLLELQEKIGKVSKGLQKKELEELETFKFKSQSDQNQCTICRDDFQIQQQCLRLKCSHIFHADCAKPWLQIQKTCPLCKNEIKL